MMDLLEDRFSNIKVDLTRDLDTSGDTTFFSCDRCAYKSTCPMYSPGGSCFLRKEILSGTFGNINEFEPQDILKLMYSMIKWITLHEKTRVIAKGGEVDKQALGLMRLRADLLTKYLNILQTMQLDENDKSLLEEVNEKDLEEVLAKINNVKKKKKKKGEDK